MPMGVGVLVCSFVLCMKALSSSTLFADELNLPHLLL